SAARHRRPRTCGGPDPAHRQAVRGGTGRDIPRQRQRDRCDRHGRLRRHQTARLRGIMEQELVQYEGSEKIATISLNRPEAANAQNPELLRELDARWTAAADDPDVHVIVLRGNGKHFSAGHDIKAKGNWPSKITLANLYEIEARQYVGYSLKWRNVP